MWASIGCRLIKSLSDALWVACSLTKTKREELCSRTNTLHMLQCTGLEKMQGAANRDSIYGGVDRRAVCYCYLGSKQKAVCPSFKKGL